MNKGGNKLMTIKKGKWKLKTKATER